MRRDECLLETVVVLCGITHDLFRSVEIGDVTYLSFESISQSSCPVDIKPGAAAEIPCKYIASN